MTGMLAEGALLVTERGDQVEVVELLGSGGQGEVYRVRTADGGQAALKWYYPACATAEQQGIVQGLVARDFEDDRFLWPLAFVPAVADAGPGFGYLMELRPDRFRGLPALFRRQLRTSTVALLTACLQTVEAYQALHSRGIAYRDISWGNLFFDPANGDILVCDNDNAVVEGDASGIGGTMEFMAPELVRGDPGARPGTQSDLHSLSVLLFMVLMNHHPLKGRLELAIHCLDEAAERQLYGRQPVFMFDPVDSSNRPDPVEQGAVAHAWEAFPQSLRALFVHNFTVGLRDPSARVRESQWRDALRAVLDAVVECAGCGRQNATEPSATGPGACWGCGRTLVLPPRLVVITPPPRSERRILLRRGARLQQHHLVAEPARHDYGDRTLVAELVEHPSRPGRFGLLNRSDSAWTGLRTDGTTQQIAPGQTVPLRAGLELDLGPAWALVVAP
ncbi:protein kinase domain-containing protein [Streptacidiphilus carbonis]|uniref:protein kinase domain-containing protein n=1 Tax=Streptacidiphilus carbonis TaxID=105422 RepID=UPI0005AA955B|nr:protein kinase [Streptacidiphilus carbonis]